MIDTKYLIVFTSIILSAIAIYISIPTDNTPYENVDEQQQTIGIASNWGCLRTSFTDEELTSNRIMTRRLGLPTIYLCYLNGRVQ